MLNKAVGHRNDRHVHWPKERHPMIEYNPIAESNNFIILERYIREWMVAEGYQSLLPICRIRDMLAFGEE
jgi:hypothetical protein